MIKKRSKKVIVLHNNAVLIQFNIKWLWQLSSMGFSSVGLVGGISAISFK